MEVVTSAINSVTPRQAGACDALGSPAGAGEPDLYLSGEPSWGPRGTFFLRAPLSRNPKFHRRAHSSSPTA